MSYLCLSTMTKTSFLQSHSYNLFWNHSIKNIYKDVMPMHVSTPTQHWSGKSSWDSFFLLGEQWMWISRNETVMAAICTSSKHVFFSHFVKLSLQLWATLEPVFTCLHNFVIMSRDAFFLCTGELHGQCHQKQKRQTFMGSQTNLPSVPQWFLFPSWWRNKSRKRNVCKDQFFFVLLRVLLLNQD